MELTGGVGCRWEVKVELARRGGIRVEEVE